MVRMVAGLTQVWERARSFSLSLVVGKDMFYYLLSYGKEEVAALVTTAQNGVPPRRKLFDACWL